MDKLLKELIEQLIDNYVNSWYKAKISDDGAFDNEIRWFQQVSALYRNYDNYMVIQHARLC